jgi:putative endonuclease
MREYYVYIMSSYRGTLYTGVTNDLTRRVYEHREKLKEGFTKRYNISKLVFYESTSDVNSAITREKQIKGWLRSKKIALVESMNPYWEDLADGVVEEPTTSPDPSLRSG